MTAKRVLDGRIKLPATELVSVAASCIRALHTHYTQECERAENDPSVVTDITIDEVTDVDISLREVDPMYWVHTRRSRGLQLPRDWTESEIARRTELSTRLAEVLAIAKIPKAGYVIPDAVKHYRGLRESGRALSDEEKREDSILDLLVFLSEKRERAELFQVDM